MQKLIERIVNDKKIFIAVICSLVLIIVLCTAGIVWLAGSNDEKQNFKDQLILSADFNDNENGFVSDAWTQNVTEFEYSKTGGIDNSGCLKVYNTVGNDARYSIDIDVESDSYYKISGWIKTEDIGENEGSVGANISVMKNFESYEDICGTEDWKKIEFYGKTDKNQEKITLALRIGFYSGENTGTAWFDNITVYHVANVPENVVCLNFAETLNQTSNSEDSEEELALDENFYSDMTSVVQLLIIFVFIAFVIAYRFARAYDGFGRKEPLAAPAGGAMSLAKGIIAIMMIGFLIRVILALTPMQCSVDVNIFKYWGNQIVSGGFTETYNTLKDSIDYPPLYVYVLYMASSVKDLFAGSEYQDMIYSLLIKFMPIVADCIIGLFIYKICDKKMSASWKVFVVAAWMLNPVVIIDSAVWGQVDSILALFVLITIYFAHQKKFLASGIALGLGAMLKPQAIIVAPIVFYMLLKYVLQEKDEISKKVKSFVYTALGFIGGVVVPCLPFMFKMGMVETEVFGKTLNLPWIFSLFIGTANHYSYASVNSLNFWYLMRKNWVDDSTEFANITLFTWGMGAIVIICILAWVFYLLYKDKKNKYMPYLFAGILYLGVTMFGPRMHERYFFPAVAFLAVVFILSNSRIWLWMYAAVSAFGFLTIAEVLFDLEVGKYLQDSGAEYDRYAHFLWMDYTTYRMSIAIMMVLITLAITVLIILTVFNVLGNRPKFERIWKIEGEVDDEVEKLNKKNKQSNIASGKKIKKG